MWLLEDKDPTLFYSSTVINEYLVVLTPSEEVCKDVAKIKSHLKKNYGHFASENSKAHFTLANFLCNENQASKIESIFKEITPQISPTEINLNSIKSFQYSGTIYIDPVNKTDLINISKLIYKALVINGFSKKHLLTPKTPHLTLARKLNKTQFKLASDELIKMNYKKSFQMKEINILKRVNKKYQVYLTFNIF